MLHVTGSRLNRRRLLGVFSQQDSPLGQSVLRLSSSQVTSDMGTSHQVVDVGA